MNVNWVLKKSASGPAQINQSSAAGDDLVELGLKIMIALEGGHHLVHHLKKRPLQLADVGRFPGKIIDGNVAELVCGEKPAHSLGDQIERIVLQ